MGDNVVVVALECTNCVGKGRYHIRKNKKVQRDKLELKKYCCRRIILTHVDLMDKLLAYDESRFNDVNNLLAKNLEKMET